MVKLLQENPGGGIESDDPAESEDVVESDQDNRNLRDRNSWALNGLPESVSLMTAMELFDTDESQKSGFSGWLLVSGN